MSDEYFCYYRIGEINSETFFAVVSESLEAEFVSRMQDSAKVIYFLERSKAKQDHVMAMYVFKPVKGAVGVLTDRALFRLNVLDLLCRPGSWSVEIKGSRKPIYSKELYSLHIHNRRKDLPEIDGYLDTLRLDHPNGFTEFDLCSEAVKSYPLDFI